MAFITIYDATDTDKQQLSQYLSETDHHWEYVDEPIGLDNLKPESEIISVFVSSRVTREIIEKLPKLRLIACRSTGYNNIDFAATEEHDISIVNVPSYGEHTVAEYTFTLLLSLARKLLQTVEVLHDSEFDQEVLTGFDLASKTIGIVGFGRIGQCVAKIAKGFSMRVIVFDPDPDVKAGKNLGVQFVSLYELAEQSDVVSLHAPYSSENRHVINDEFLQHVKPTAVLINTARGELIDTSALIEALHEKRLGGAGLDVLEGEQLLKAEEEMFWLRRNQVPQELLLEDMQISVLRRMPNVVITPHNAFNTAEAISRINKTTAQNMIRYWYGETPYRVQTTLQVQPGKLLIIRHGESEWNALGKWTGTTDVHLSEKGFHEAALLGQIIKDIHIDYAFASQQIRTLETLEGILDASQQFDVPYERSAAINERDYGDYTGMNKWEVRDQLGEEVFQSLRREWDYPVPNGETIKMVYERVIPFYKETILPRLKAGKTVLMVSHGNAIRALIKYIERLSDDEIGHVEMPFGNVIMYEVNDEGYQVAKNERHIETAPPPA